MRFIDGNNPRLQRCDAFRIVVRANDLVACLGKTGSGNQSHVSATNDCDSQCNSFPLQTPKNRWPSPDDKAKQLRRLFSIEKIPQTREGGFPKPKELTVRRAKRADRNSRLS